MHVCYRQPRRLGPEATLEDAAAACLPQLFPGDGLPRWAGGSYPMGAGMPDLMFVSWDPRIEGLADTDIGHTQILAYLRGVKGATVDGVAQCLCQPINRIDDYLMLLSG